MRFGVSNLYRISVPDNGNDCLCDRYSPSVSEKLLQIGSETSTLILTLLYFRYLPVYKLTQDPLELLFSVIRSRLGNNNNPTVAQLRAALRSILVMRITQRRNGNCEVREDCTTRVSPLGNFQSLKASQSSDEVEVPEDEDETMFENAVLLSEFCNNIVTYIAGFVAKRLNSRTTCRTCLQFASVASNAFDDIDSIFIKLKDRGGLIHPSRDVVRVCQLTEMEVRRVSQESLQNLNRTLVIKQVLRRCVQEEVFHDLRSVINEDHPPLSDHALTLMKSAAELYWKVRVHHIARQATLKMKPDTNRNECTKNIIFRGN